jgi:hypothetical protein
VTPARMQQIIDSARSQLDTGVIYEPRGYPLLFANGGLSHAPIALPGQVIQPLIDQPYFTNGEQFPVKITHVVLGGFDPEQDLLEFQQRVGLRLRYHDNFYPNPFYMPLPAWQNRPSSLPDYMNRATSVWTFDEANILGQEDTLKVSLRYATPTGFGSIDASVAFHGFGILSRRPYTIAGTITLDPAQSSVPHDINAIVYRDDSSEPIALYQMVVTCTAPVPQQGFQSQGDTRGISIQVKQSGNSSRAQWFQSMRSVINQFATDQSPVSLVGAHGGQGLVHRLVEPWIWNPGEGFQADALNIDLAEVENLYSFGAMALGTICIR